MTPPDETGHGKSSPEDDLGFDLPEPARLSATRILALGAVGVAVLGAAFLIGWMPRKHAQKELAAQVTAVENAPLRVDVVRPKVGQSDRSMALPGSVQPLEETTIYPRANGYVRKWNVDIGDKVKDEQVLAEIDTPELDQQLDQAKAQLAQAEASLVQAKANHNYAKQNLARYEQLAPAGVASQQELDQKQAQQVVDESNVRVAEANVEAQKANIRRLLQLKSFAHITAPFAGTVNARMIERGALVSQTTPLFKVSITDPVRVFVQVPQDVAPSIRNDVPAQVRVREFAGIVFEGKVARSAGSLDAQSRTMNTEVRIPNPDNKLIAGMYAQVAITLPSPHRVFELPSTAIMSDGKGVRVAIVGPDQKIKLVPVTVERDTGPFVEISTGLVGDERVVKLVSAELVDGRPVEIVTK